MAWFNRSMVRFISRRLSRRPVVAFMVPQGMSSAALATPRRTSRSWENTPVDFYSVVGTDAVFDFVYAGYAGVRTRLRCGALRGWLGCRLNHPQF